ncbi:hypothetical protein ACIP5Y_04070 [Nocardia sp. NPDC088792]|uniref:hypothetical protein n=1 Tax=Nocardia sp. NPDC088792 TaxID=3364332 RepID=UPI00381CBCE5
MADKVEVDPAALRAASRKTADIQHSVETALTGLKQRLASRGSPWGDDKYGHNFAGGSDGKPGYQTIRDNILAGTDAMAKTLEGFVSGQVSAANSLDRTDAHSADTFQPAATPPPS